jgi:FKBP-type peptidyl-prolyl cis-trans isomerase
MTNFLRRAGWLFLALLFIVTGLGVGVVAFWQSTHQNNSNVSPPPPNPNQLQGTKLSNFTPVAKIDSLQTIDTKTGSGGEAKASSKVTVNYTGAVAATGVIFQSSLDSGKPVTFALDQVIQGWKEGIPGMKAGGERRLLIPAAMAYGSSPPAGSGIPADADLVFDVTLLAVQ